MSNEKEAYISYPEMYRLCSKIKEEQAKSNLVVDELLGLARRAAVGDKVARSKLNKLLSEYFFVEDKRGRRLPGKSGDLDKAVRELCYMLRRWQSHPSK